MYSLCYIYIYMYIYIYSLFVSSIQNIWCFSFAHVFTYLYFLQFVAFLFNFRVYSLVIKLAGIET